MFCYPSLNDRFEHDAYFAGVTYLLSVLSLHDEFESLHWFDSVAQKYNEEEQMIENLLAGQPNELKNTDNTLKLSIRRLKLYKKVRYEQLLGIINYLKFCLR